VIIRPIAPAMRRAVRGSAADPAAAPSAVIPASTAAAISAGMPAVVRRGGLVMWRRTYGDNRRFVQGAGKHFPWRMTGAPRGRVTVLAASPERIHLLAGRTLEAATSLAELGTGDPLAEHAMGAVRRVQNALGRCWAPWFGRLVADTSMTSWSAAPPGTLQGPRVGTPAQAGDDVTGAWPDLPPGSVVVTDDDLAEVFGEQIAGDLVDLAVFHAAADVGSAMGYDMGSGAGGPLSATVLASPTYSSAPLIVSAPSVEAASASASVAVATVVPAGPASEAEAIDALGAFTAAAEAGGATVIPVGAQGLVHVPQDTGEAAGTFPLAGVVVPPEAAFGLVGLSVQYRLGSPGGYEVRIVADAWPPPELDGEQFASYDTLVAIAHETAVPTAEDQVMASELGDLMATVHDVVGIGTS
jgi:hypothetical protein